MKEEDSLYKSRVYVDRLFPVLNIASLADIT